MEPSTLSGLDGRHDPSRRLLVRVPPGRTFLPVVVTACHIYCRGLAGEIRLLAEVVRTVTDLAIKAGSASETQVDVEFLLTGNMLAVSVDGEVLTWDTGETTS